MPSLAALAAVAILCIGTFALGQHMAEGESHAESPCVVSWDENDGDSTFCILTDEAAVREKRDFPIKCRQSGVEQRTLANGTKVMTSSEFCSR